MARDAFACVGWQATLCDPIWQVTLRSSVMGFPLRATLGFNLLTFNLIFFQPTCFLFEKKTLIALRRHSLESTSWYTVSATSEYQHRGRWYTLESRRKRLTKRFFRRSVIPEESCLHCLLPDKCDSSIVDKLLHFKTFHLLTANSGGFKGGRRWGRPPNYWP